MICSSDKVAGMVIAHVKITIILRNQVYIVEDYAIKWPLFHGFQVANIKEFSSIEKTCARLERKQKWKKKKKLSRYSKSLWQVL